jgi:hypothetical protein
MPKFYFYKLIVDNGGAPCIVNGLLSLAICKPMMRCTAEENDIVIGFAGNSLHADNRLIYVARVTEQVKNGEYYRSGKYKQRPDCIYEWQDGRFEQRQGAVYHGSPGDLVHDLGAHPTYERANTLLSREFCYFGASGSDAYKKAFPIVTMAVEALRRGHRVNHGPKLLAELEKLVQWSCDLRGPGIQGMPKSQPRRGESHRGGGCGVAYKKGAC